MLIGLLASHRKVRRANPALAIGLALVAAGLTACAVPSDPQHVAYGTVTNGCENPIRAGIAEYSDDFDPESRASSFKLVEPGDRVEFFNPLSLPLGPTLFVWVAPADAVGIGDPQEVPLSEVRQETEADGTTIYNVTVDGDMCR